MRGRRVPALVGVTATVLALTACTHGTRHGSVSGCGNPTATASTRQPKPIGATGAPRVGPFTFHPYPYRRGYPTKMVIHAVARQPRPFVLRGYRCSDALALRFRYDQGAPERPGPFSASALEAQGVEAQTLAPITAGGDHTGYVLPTGTGDWLVVVGQAGATVGTLRLDVES